jgi:hypothetical protein
VAWSVSHFVEEVCQKARLKLKVLFYVAKFGTTWDKIIAWWTHGRYSHCELQFSDGVCFSSSNRDGGTRFKHIDVKPWKWDVVPLVVTEAEELVVRMWCTHLLGHKYDWLGVLGFVFHRRHLQDYDRWYCSEVVSAALRGCLEIKVGAEVSPSELYKELTHDS